MSETTDVYILYSEYPEGTTLIAAYEDENVAEEEAEKHRCLVGFVKLHKNKKE